MLDKLGILFINVCMHGFNNKKCQICITHNYIKDIITNIELRLEKIEMFNFIITKELIVI